jgi:uncharacterized protein YchJ
MLFQGEENIVKMGRNKRCPCGSGKKYIKCCYQKSGTNKKMAFKDDSQKEPTVTVRITNIPYKEKMSEVLLAFAKPLTDKCKDDDSFYFALQIAQLAWNIALSCEKIDQIKEEKYKTFVNHLQSLSDKEIAEDALWAMVRRKQVYFQDIKRVIVNFAIHKEGDNKKLAVTSTPLK